MLCADAAVESYRASIKFAETLLALPKQRGPKPATMSCNPFKMSDFVGDLPVSVNLT